MLKYIGFFPLYAALWTIINSENIEFAMVMPDTIKLKTKNQMTTNHVVKCELGVRELGKFKIKNCQLPEQWTLNLTQTEDQVSTSASI